MYRGRYPLGTEIPLGVLCLDGSGRPVLPDACPAMDVYGPGGKVVRGRALPPLEGGFAPGLFQGRLFLGAAFGVGPHRVVYRWQISGAPYASRDDFDLIAGGDPLGAVLAMAFIDRPQASYLLRQHNSGRLRRNINPRAQ